MIAVTLISIIILAIIFTLRMALVKQENNTDSFNAAKQTVMLISDTLSSQMQHSSAILASWTNTNVTFALDNGVVFTFSQNRNHSSLWDMIYQRADGSTVNLGTVGFCWENPPLLPSPATVHQVVLTFWQTYGDDTGHNRTFVLTSGYHDSLVLK